MAPEEQTRYRALTARLSCLAVDRPDLLYAAKECSRRMSRPRKKDWEAAKKSLTLLDRLPQDCPLVLAAGRAKHNNSV